MTATPLLPKLVEPDALEEVLEDERLIIVDLSSPANYRKHHVPGAVHLDYPLLTDVEPPVGGLMPPIDQLEMAFSFIGYNQAHHVVAYDDEGGGKAGRLIFTMECLGLHNWSLLNGGMQAWFNEGHPIVHCRPQVEETLPCINYLQPNPFIVDAEYIMANLGQPHLQLLDARSSDEYRDLARMTQRGGHIPGALNLEWTELMDPTRNNRLLPEAVIRARLDALGLDPAHEVITYCQTAHRSSFSFVVLYLLGYKVRGYPGSWSDWGNRDDTPIEV